MSDTMSDVHRAVYLCDVNRYDEAIELLHGVVAADPQVAQAWCVLARAWSAKGVYRTALSAVERALAVEPENEWAHRLRSAILRRMDRYPEAIWEAREATRLAPDEWQAHLLLAYSLVAAKAPPGQALAAADEARRLAPLKAESHIGYGSAAAAAGRRVEARESFEKALSLDPENSVALHELARLHLRTTSAGASGSLVKAASGFAAAVRADPHQEVSRRSLELVVLTFAIRTSYLVFLVAITVGLGVANTANLGIRVIPLVIVLLPVGYAAWFLRKLRPDVRGFALSTLRRPLVRLVPSIDAVAIVALAVEAFAPSPARIVAKYAAFVAATVAFGLAVYVRQRRHAVGPE